KRRGAVMYPPGPLIFNAFNHTPFERVKVVILGQDPYHGAGQAHGLSFSVQRGVRVPPSLQNMYKELHDDVGFVIPAHGNLEHWAKQGVFLLNTSLTVRAGAPASHQGKGWEEFTTAAVRALSEQREGLVFMLWGRHALAKRPLLDETRHLVLGAPHPSPFSAHSGIFGCRHFSRANAYLEARGQPPGDWHLPRAGSRGIAVCGQTTGARGRVGSTWPPRAALRSLPSDGSYSCDACRGSDNRTRTPS